MALIMLDPDLGLSYMYDTNAMVPDYLPIWLKIFQHKRQHIDWFKEKLFLMPDIPLREEILPIDMFRILI